MIKKALFATVAVALAVCLAACGGTVDDTTATDATELDTSVTDPTVTEDTEGTETAHAIPDGEHVHSYVSTVIEPTCSAIGCKAMKCACGDIQKIIEYLPMTAHKANEPSCGVDAVCSVCEKVITPKYDHVIKRVTVAELTCVSDGVERLLCERCGYSEEVTTKADHSLGELVLSNGKLSSSCLLCGEKVENIPFVNYHNESNSGVSFSGGSVSLDSAVKYNIPKQLMDGNTIPYQVSFTFKLTGISNSKNLVNNNNGRNIFQYQYNNNYNSIIRIFPVSDSNGGYLADTVEIGSLNEINVSSTKLLKMKVGESIKISVIIDPVEKTAEIYINGKYAMTRDGNTSAFIPESTTMSFGYGQSDAFTGSVSDISIIQVISE